MATPLIERMEGTVMPVNSYLVHGPSGVVVVDGQLTLSDAGQVRAAIDATGLPIAGVLVTHAHPDHYAGIGTLLAGRQVPVVATRSVAEIISRDDALKDSIVGPMMGAEWPPKRTFPDQLVADGESIELGGVTFQVQDLGPGESPADSLWFLDGAHVFAGDVAYHHMHCYLADGYSEQWLHTLTKLQQQLPADAVLYVGHGEPAGIELLAAQRRYIETFVAAVAEHRADDEEVRRAAVVAEMSQVEPSELLRFLMELSIAPVAQARH